MPIYVFLKKAFERGALRELFADAANANAQEALVASLGGQVIAQFAVEGHYDYVLISELSDDATAGTISLQCNGRGVRTAALRAFSRNEASAALSATAPNG